MINLFRRWAARPLLPATRLQVTPALRSDSLDAVLDWLRERYPSTFPVWEELFWNSVEEYEKFLPSSLSVAGHPTARLFGDYVCRFGRGVLLDLGCGPQPEPVYLEGYPQQLIAGVDPLPAEHPFVFAQGVAESIPWPNGAFQTVVAGTSLDHALDLKRALDEVARVLCPGGRLLVWVGFIEGGRPFNPFIDPPKPIDRWHLFHFDKRWFERELRARFYLVDRLKINSEEYFYCFQKKRGLKYW